MALTKIGSIGINTGIQFAGVTTIATLNASDNVLSVGGTVNFVSDVSIGGTVSIAGTLTYEDVTNVDAIGIITARSEIKVGSGITLSKDGDIFATGISTFSEGIAGDLLIDDKIVHRGDTDTAIRFSDADTITFETNGTERVRIDSTGKATFTTPGGDDAFLVKGDNYTSVRIQSARDSASDHAMFQMLGSRGTNASPTIVQSGDTLGTLSARGYDGNSYASSSNINFGVDGTPGDGDMPGRITFSTAADGSESPTERVRIDSSGLLQIATTSGNEKLNVHGAMRSSSSSANFNAGLEGALVDFDTSNNIARFGHVNGASGSARDVVFLSGGSEKVRIESNGYVNIGSGSAEEQLTIRNTTQHCLIRIISANSTGANAGIDFGDSDDTDVGRIRYYHDDGSSQNYMRFDTNGGERLRITSDGGVSMLNDNAQLRIGAGGDLQLYHDTTGTPGTVIKNITGHLYMQSIGDVKLRTNDSEIAVDCQANGAVHLHHDGASDSNLYTRYDGLTIRNNNVESTKDCNVDMIARVDGSAQFHMYADDATDNNKKFQIKASNGETMDFNSYYTGGWDFHLRFSKGANNTSDRKVQVGKGGLRFDLAAEDYRDIDGDGHLFRRDGQAQIGVDDFLYIHDIDTGANSLRLKHRFETNTGNYHLNGTVTPNAGLDYAEYFEWSDGNPSNEDRIGHTVSVDGLTGKIKIAEEGETVIGVISGTAGFASGAHAFSWQGRFKRDEWGRGVYEEQKDENGNLIYSDAETRAQIVKVEPVETEEYNPSLENSYVPRELRKEWDIVGLMGQIRVRKTAVIPSNWVKLKEIDSVKDLYLVK